MTIPIFLLIVAVWFFANVWAAWCIATAADDKMVATLVFVPALLTCLITSGTFLVYFAKWWNGVL